MIAQPTGEHIKSTIASVTQPVWTALGIECNAENVWNDLACSSGHGIEATFYIAGLDNVVRKDFNVHALALKQANPNITEFKVKFKRPEKEVRFYIKYSPASAAIATSEAIIN
jgi:hypothetical protein